MAKRSHNQQPDTVKRSPELPQKKHQRTARVCDRCRIKKLKCNGGHCRACLKSDSACLYTHPRHSASRTYQMQMRDIMNEGIRRLYLACKRNSCFPGPLPEVPNADGDDNNVSIHAILQCLGLIPSPGPVMFSPGSHETLENQTRKLALVPEPDEDGCRQGQSEIRDNLLKDSRLSAELKGDILPPTCGTKEDEKDAQDDTPFAVQEKLTRSRLVPSTDFVSNPQSALPVDTKAISSDTLFPHLLMSPDNSIDHSGPTTPADPYLDSAQSFSGGPSCTPELGQTSFLKPMRKMPPGYSYFVERERFYRSFFGSSNGHVDNQNYQPDIKDFLPLWPGAQAPFPSPGCGLK